MMTFLQAAYQSVGPKDCLPPILPKVEVEAVTPFSPSILKRKDEAVEEETILVILKDKKYIFMSASCGGDHMN